MRLTIEDQYELARCRRNQLARNLYLIRAGGQASVVLDVARFSSNHKRSSGDKSS
jgi:hypothetical protein